MSNGTIDSSIWPVWYIGGGCSSMHGSGFGDVSNKYFNKHHNEQLMPKQCTFYIVCKKILQISAFFNTKMCINCLLIYYPIAYFDVYYIY